MNDKISEKIQSKLGKHSLFYVCRDIERAEGLCTYLNKYLNTYIITNKSPYSSKLKKKYPDNIILINKKKILDTHELLQFVANSHEPIVNKDDFIIVFKNTKKIERICRENNWRLLNPSAEIASTAEEKLSQIEWLGNLKKYLPGYEIMEMNKMEFTGQNFIIQFNYSHTGSGTLLIESKKQLEEIKQKFPHRLARIAKYIEGPLLTNNNVVWPACRQTGADKILIGNISYQITGLKPFTKNQFATIGNDWALGKKLLNEKQLVEYKKIVEEVGENFIKSNWKGSFGIDVVLEESSGKLYLLEINARQTANTSCESWLQQLGTWNLELGTLSIFDAHLASLLEIPYDNEELIKISDGAQIILRKSQEPRAKSQKPIVSWLQTHGYKLIKYNNKKEEADLLRIQSKTGIMEKHNQFNKLGKQIVKSISNSPNS